MSSVHSFKDFIRERLTAGGNDIFTVFEQTVVPYEEEIHRQRRLLDATRKPGRRLHKDLPEEPVCEEEEEEEEEEEGPAENSSQEGEPLELKQETDACVETAAREQSDHSEQLLSLSSAAAQSPDSGSTRNTDLKPKKRRHRNTEDNSLMSESLCDPDTKQKVCKM